MSSLTHHCTTIDSVPQPSPLPAAPGLPTRVLHIAGIRATDQVIVVGRRTLEHMLACHRHECRAVIAIHPDRPMPAIPAADAIWLADGTTVTPKMMAVIQGARNLRTVVVETTGSGTRHRLPQLLDDLRFEGFVQVAAYEVGGRHLVVAARPDWLRRIV